MNFLMNELQKLPSLDALLQEKHSDKLIRRFGRKLTTDAIRVSLESFRESIKKGASSPEHNSIFEYAERFIEYLVEAIACTSYQCQRDNPAYQSWTCSIERRDDKCHADGVILIQHSGI